jgi:hypothetical protein
MYYMFFFPKKVPSEASTQNLLTLSQFHFRVKEAASPKPKGTCSTVYSHIPLPSIQEAEAGSGGGAPPASSSSLIVPLSPEEAARGRLAMADASGNPAGMLISLDIYLSISENTKTSSIDRNDWQ